MAADVAVWKVLAGARWVLAPYPSTQAHSRHRDGAVHVYPIPFPHPHPPSIRTPLTDSNIGDYTTIAEGVSPGTHRVNCINLNETDTADGGHDFRIISIVSS